MTATQQIQIITVYSAAKHGGRRRGLRVLAAISLLAAGAWFWVLQYKMDRWLKLRLQYAALAEMSRGVDEPDPNVWAQLGLAPPTKKSIISKQELRARAAQGARHIAVLTADMYAWKGIALLAGGWLALASLLGCFGRRVARRMLRQSAWLIILSTVATIAGIEIAIRWGGMPDEANLNFYAKIAAVQSSYAWFLLVATRFVR